MSQSSEASPALSIQGEFTIFTAADLKAQLLGAIRAAEAEDIEIDLGGVSAIDTAGLQLMLMAKREAAAVGRSVHFVRHSDEVLELINLCDLAGEFGDPLLVHPFARDAS